MRGRYIWYLGAMIPVFVVASMGCQRGDAVAAPLRQGSSQTPVNPLPIPKDFDGIPTALRLAAETLFAQGLADPRGGEYRVITVRVGSVWQGGGGVVETDGWVLPDAGDGKRTAACWNGLTYSVVEVKQPADLAADIQKRLDAQAEYVRKNGQHIGIMGLGGMPGHATPEAVSVSVENNALLKVVLLLRLGETKLAQSLGAAWKVDSPTDANRPDEHKLDPYLTLASQWVWSLYDRAVCAHMRGDDQLAASDAVLLTRIQPLIDAEAKKRGYKTFPNGSVRVSANGEILKEIATFFPFLSNLPELRRDSERRLAEKTRPPLDMVALKKRPQAERIAELIVRLDEIDARQSGQPGGVGLDAHPVSYALIAEEDAAIEPLLDVIEKDDRLTRSVSFGRDFFQNRNLLTVKSAAFTCFARITQIGEIGDGKLSIAVLREWWAKNKKATSAERWLAQLADEGTKPPEAAPNASNDEQSRLFRERSAWENARRKRWEEAAARIVERADIRQEGMWVNAPDRRPGKPVPPFKGESLRSKRNPSVSDLLRTRALELSAPTEGRWGFDVVGGARFALMLYEWDPKGAQTLPTLQAVMKNCLDFYGKLSRKENGTDQYQLAGRMARLVTARLRLGDTAAVTEYRVWLRTVSPAYLGSESRSGLYPLMRDWANPEMRRLADDLFTVDDGQRTVWNQLFTPLKQQSGFNGDLLASDLLQYPAFRALVLKRLTDTTEAGTLTNRGVKWADGSQESGWISRNATETPQTLRLCDRVALALQQLKGSPLFDPLTSVAERDKRCAAIAAFLTRYQKTLGRLPAGERPLYGHDGDYSIFDYLGPLFPVLTRPGTEADVRENRAIFTLNDKTARVVTGLPRFPLAAQWRNDPDAPVTVDGQGKQIRWSTGHIWQAEEVLVDGKWVRYYGYVGPHRIAKVPAGEIDLVGR